MPPKRWREFIEEEISPHVAHGMQASNGRRVMMMYRRRGRDTKETARTFVAD